MSWFRDIIVKYNACAYFFLSIYKQKSVALPAYLLSHRKTWRLLVVFVVSTDGWAQNSQVIITALYHTGPLKWKYLFMLTELFASQITHIYTHYFLTASIKRLEAWRIKRYYPLLILNESLTDPPAPTKKTCFKRCRKTTCFKHSTGKQVHLWQETKSWLSV